MGIYLRLLASFLFHTLKITVKLGFLILPAFLVLFVLTEPRILMGRGLPYIEEYQAPEVHEIMPHTKWGHMKPCSEFMNEQEEFNKALQCANEKAWPDSPLEGKEHLPLVPPRCFVVSTASPDVFSADDGSFNFIPLIGPFGLEGGIVGVYQQESMTVYVVENTDMNAVYRHELQHYFLHLHNPETEGGGHDQHIWSVCEPPYYTPSDKAIEIGRLRGPAKGSVKVERHISPKTEHDVIK